MIQSEFASLGRFSDESLEDSSIDSAKHNGFVTLPVSDDIEEFTVCTCCRRVFDETERAPKLLACRHHFCLACVRGVLAIGSGGHVRCPHCGTRTAAPPQLLPTHGAVLALRRRLTTPSPSQDKCEAHGLPSLWCGSCETRACRACSEHTTHMLREESTARVTLARDTASLHEQLRRLAASHAEHELRALDAAASLRHIIESQLLNPPIEPAPPSPASLSSLVGERDRLRARLGQAMLRARLDDIVHRAVAPLDFDLIRRALAAPDPSPGDLQAADSAEASERRDPLVFLANYCTAALYSRAAGGGAGGAVPRHVSAFPLCWFVLEVGGARCGRVVIEVRADVAPRMARNFVLLARGEGCGGVGYRGTQVFQCWGGESVIAGDVELDNGRGGRSALPERHFLPEATGLGAVRGAVGMRREQRRRGGKGLVGSQFRIVLRDMRGFSAIFGAVAEGLDLVDRLSRTGDAAGKPHQPILIADCGTIN